MNIHDYIPVRPPPTRLEKSEHVTPLIRKGLQSQCAKSQLIFRVLEDADVMSIPRDGLGIFSGWKQILTQVEHRDVPMMGFSGEKIQHTFVVSSFVHEIV